MCNIVYFSLVLVYPFLSVYKLSLVFSSYRHNAHVVLKLKIHFNVTSFSKILKFKITTNVYQSSSECFNSDFCK